MILRRTAKGLGILIAIGAALVALLLLLFLIRLERGIPRLDGAIAAPGLSAPVAIDRDAAGVPTITGRTRADVAFATGYLHAQERFFQMDTLRRAAAGELGELFGAVALKSDERTRLHLFRLRARAVLARQRPDERRMLDAYVAGINRGLADLHAPPFEYALLRRAPAPWRAEDSLLVVYAMYLDLEDDAPELELSRARATARVGSAMADILYPVGTELDAPIDGSRLAPPPLPARLGAQVAALPTSSSGEERMVKGSNDWAVSGAHTATGAAMVANDMHLGLRIPNTWYRARLVVPGSLDITGVTLPGVFPIVVGSNRHVAWGFTDSYADLHDAVIVEGVPRRVGWYRTPAGPRPLQIVHQRLCAKDACRDFAVRNTIWGPIVATLPDGREVADRWIAHDARAVRLAPMLALEQARTVPEALAAAHIAGLPDENMVVGDSAGHVAWTIIGALPRRFGFDGRDAVSWADETLGWNGYLAPDEIPTILDPPQGRVWTANGRVVDGAMLAKLGDGNYDDGARARRIAQHLFARDRFTERDMLAIQLDDTAIRALFWRTELLGSLIRHQNDPRFAAMIGSVAQWNGRADTDSVAYRLIRTFRSNCLNAAYAAYVGKPGDATLPSYGAPSAEGAMRRLLRERPAALVPPGFASWDAFLDRALGDLATAVDRDAGGTLAHYTWGAWMTADIHHPLAQAIPFLGLLTDPKDQAMPGDGGTVRAQYHHGGASERLVVSPGHEEQALFHMPGGQSGAPLAPYYLAGHRDWVEGRPTPLLPGPTRWRLVLHP